MVGGWCTYDYNVSLSPNLWILTFDLDLDLDLGLTTLILEISFRFSTVRSLALVH